MKALAINSGSDCPGQVSRDMVRAAIRAGGHEPCGIMPDALSGNEKGFTTNLNLHEEQRADGK